MGEQDRTFVVHVKHEPGTMLKEEQNQADVIADDGAVQWGVSTLTVTQLRVTGWVGQEDDCAFKTVMRTANMKRCAPLSITFIWGEITSQKTHNGSGSVLSRSMKQIINSFLSHPFHSKKTENRKTCTEAKESTCIGKA